MMDTSSKVNQDYAQILFEYIDFKSKKEKNDQNLGISDRLYMWAGTHNS